MLHKLEELLHCVDQEPERLTFLCFVRQEHLCADYFMFGSPPL